DRLLVDIAVTDLAVDRDVLVAGRELRRHHVVAEAKFTEADRAVAGGTRVGRERHAAGDTERQRDLVHRLRTFAIEVAEGRAGGIEVRVTLEHRDEDLGALRHLGRRRGRRDVALGVVADAIPVAEDALLLAEGEAGDAALHRRVDLFAGRRVGAVQLDTAEVLRRATREGVLAGREGGEVHHARTRRRLDDGVGRQLGRRAGERKRHVADAVAVAVVEEIGALIVRRAGGEMYRHGRAGLLTAQVLRRDEPGALHRLVRQEVRERGHAGGREILLVDRATIHGAEQVLRRGLERHAAVDAVVAKETGEGDIALRVGRALELRAGRMLHREADARRAVRAVGEERLEVGARRVVAEVTGVDVQQQRRGALDRGDVGRRLVVQRFGRCRGRNLGWRNRRGINDLLGWRHRGIDDLLGRRGDGRSRRFGGRHRCRRRGGGGRRLARIDDEPVTLDLLAEHVDECRDAVLVEFLLVARLTLVFAEEVIRAVLDRDVTEEAVVTVRQAGEGHLPFVVHLFLNGCAVGANERQRDRLFGIVRAIRGEILEG